MMGRLAHNVTVRWTLGLLPFLTAVATAQQANPDPGVNFYSIEKEVALGRQLSADFQRNANLLASPATQTFVDDLGQRLAAHARNSAFTYTLRLIADDPTLLHEPAAFPGGFVFVPVRLILAAKEEGELAGMLAHAIAHVAARHGTQQASRAEILHTIPLVYVGSAAGSAIPRDNTLVAPMKLRAMSRVYELEADRLAVGIMSAAGYDPAALVRYIEREQSSDEASPNPWSALPPPTERLSALHSAIMNLPPGAYEPHPGFEAIQAEVRRLGAQ
jgi:beta-barrel assembly-enhancing protease